MKKIADKPFNHGTMTDSAFFGWLRSGLRRKWIAWKPRAEALKKVRRKYVGINKRQKFEYLCSECNEYFNQKEVAVHHLIPCGSLTTFNDLPSFVQNLFSEIESYAVVCKKCHQIETNNERKERKLNKIK